MLPKEVGKEDTNNKNKYLDSIIPESMFWEEFYYSGICAAMVVNISIKDSVIDK